MTIKKDQKKYVQRGESHCNAKLTEQKVAKIRMLRKTQGLSYAKLGAQFNVSAGTVCRICNNEAWVS